MCPLDAALSLPPRCYSDLLREWADYGSTDGSYRESGTALAHILGLPVSVQALETAVAEDAQDVDHFYGLRQESDEGCVRIQTTTWWERPRSGRVAALADA